MNDSDDLRTRYFMVFNRPPNFEFWTAILTAVYDNREVAEHHIEGLKYVWPGCEFVVREMIPQELEQPSIFESTKRIITV